MKQFPPDEPRLGFRLGLRLGRFGGGGGLRLNGRGRFRGGRSGGDRLRNGFRFANGLRFRRFCGGFRRGGGSDRFRGKGHGVFNRPFRRCGSGALLRGLLGQRRHPLERGRPRGLYGIGGFRLPGGSGIRAAGRGPVGGGGLPAGLFCRSRGDGGGVVEGKAGLVGGDGVLRLRGGQDGLGPGAVPAEGGQHRVVHGGKHLLLALEFHLRLGGVDVHVHRVGLDGEVQHAAGETANHLLVFVGFLQRGHHGAALDVAAIDEKVLIAPAAPAAGGQGHVAGHGHAFAGAGDLRKAQGQIPAQHGVHRALQLAVPGGEQLLPPVPDELDGHLRVGQGQPLDVGEHGGPLGGVLFHEFQPGGGVVEQVPHHHGGAVGAAGLLLLQHDPGLQMEGGAQRRAGGLGQQVDAADGGDGGQSFAPEAQSADGLQIVLGGDLGGSVAEEGGGGLIGRNAAAVVRDPDEGHAAVLDLHGDGGGPGVDGVFHQLLHHGGRALHHLAGGDEIRDVRIELSDDWHKNLLGTALTAPEGWSRGRRSGKIPACPRRTRRAPRRSPGSGTAP